MAEEKRVSVVTGGALGIGGAISRRLAAAGDLVVLNDIDADAAERARHDIEASGGRCVTVIGDIVEDATVAEVAAAALAHGRVDVLVNNVGDFRPAAPSFQDASGAAEAFILSQRGPGSAMEPRPWRGTSGYGYTRRLGIRPRPIRKRERESA